MNSYERVVTVLNGEIPDRVPSFELMIDPKVIRGIIGTENYMDLCDELDIDVVMTETPSKCTGTSAGPAEKNHSQ